jgi:hypothetical protein
MKSSPLDGWNIGNFVTNVWIEGDSSPETNLLRQVSSYLPGLSAMFYRGRISVLKGGTISDHTRIMPKVKRDKKIAAKNRKK